MYKVVAIRKGQYDDRIYKSRAESKTPEDAEFYISDVSHLGSWMQPIGWDTDNVPKVTDAVIESTENAVDVTALNDAISMKDKQIAALEAKLALAVGGSSEAAPVKEVHVSTGNALADEALKAAKKK